METSREEIEVFERVDAIVTDLDEEIFETLVSTCFDAWCESSLGHEEAKKKYEEALKQAGLTDDEWTTWYAE